MRDFLVFLLVIPQILSTPIQNVSWRDYKNLATIDGSSVLLSPLRLQKQRSYRQIQVINSPHKIVKVINEYPLEAVIGEQSSNAFDKLSTILASRDREVYSSLDFNFPVGKRDEILFAMSPEKLESNLRPKVKLSRKTFRSRLLNL